MVQESSRVFDGFADNAGAGVRLRDAWHCRAASAIFSAPAVVAATGAVLLAGVEGVLQLVSFHGNPLWRCKLSSPIFAPIRVCGSLPGPPDLPASRFTSLAAAVFAAPGAMSGAAAGAYPTESRCPAAAAPATGPSATSGDVAGDGSALLAAAAAGAEPECMPAAAPLALVATQDGGLHCVDARSGNLIWRRALACGDPSGASGAALEARLGHAFASWSAHRFSSGVTPDDDLRVSHGAQGRSPAAGRAEGSCAQDAVDVWGSTASNDCPPGAAPVPDAVSAPRSDVAHLAMCSTSGAVAVLRCAGACPSSCQPEPLGGAREADGTPECKSRVIQGISGDAKVEAAGGTLQPGSLAASQGVRKSSPRRVTCEEGSGSPAGSQGLREPSADPGIACSASLEPGQVQWSQGSRDPSPNPGLGLPSLVAGSQLPAESFSAPVAFDGRMVLGCRDDHVYCLMWT